MPAQQSDHQLTRTRNREDLRSEQPSDSFLRNDRKVIHLSHSNGSPFHRFNLLNSQSIRENPTSFSPPSSSASSQPIASSRFATVAYLLSAYGSIPYFRVS